MNASCVLFTCAEATPLAFVVRGSDITSNYLGGVGHSYVAEWRGGVSCVYLCEIYGGSLLWVFDYIVIE